MKKIHLILSVALLTIVTLSSCTNSPNSKPNVLSDKIGSSNNSSIGVPSGAWSLDEGIKINDSIVIYPVDYVMQGSQMNDQDIIKMCEHLFTHCSELYTNLSIFMDIEYEKSTAINFEEDVWYKTKNINGFSEYQSIFESFFSSSFYSEQVQPLAMNCFVEKENVFYFCPNRVGGGGGSYSFIPDSIKVIAKENEKIVVQAKMVNTDGDSNYTFIVQNGHWVLQTPYGEDPDAALKEFPVEQDKYRISNEFYVSPLLYDIPGNQLDDITVVAMGKSLFMQSSLLYKMWYQEPAIPSNLNAAKEIQGILWYPTEYITSLSEYQSVFQSLFSQGFYKNNIQPTLDSWLIEMDGKLYIAPDKFPANESVDYLLPKSILVTSKSEKEIVIEVKFEDNEQELFQYTLIVENNHWVLKNWTGD